jgi:ABC-type transporter Mla MlaB component
MLRITAVSSPAQALTLRLEGQIVGRWVKELKRSCEELNANGQGLVLDLVGVSFIDTDGLALLGGLSNRKVSLINPSMKLRILCRKHISQPGRRSAVLSLEQTAGRGCSRSCSTPSGTIAGNGSEK